MTRYYFDLRDGNAFVIDEEGMELCDMRSAQGEAARALAGVGWDAMRVDGGARPTNGNRGARRARTGDGSQVLVRDRTQAVRPLPPPERCRGRRRRGFLWPLVNRRRRQ